MGILQISHVFYLLLSERQMADEILQGCPSLEIYNSCFTPNYGLWALGFCGDIFGKDNPGCVLQDKPLCSVTSLDLSNRSIHNLVNKVSFFPFTFFREAGSAVY